MKEQESEVTKAVREIYKVDKYWEHPLYHEGMTEEEVLKLRDELKKPKQ